MTDRGVNMNIDDMRVGDFLHLMDCMQEECYEQKVRTAKCYGCKYYDVCDIGIDPDDFDTYTLKKVIEEYAEMNGLIDHMHYVNDQKWIPCSDILPDKDGSYLIQKDYGVIDCLYYADGWNCRRDYLSGEIYREYELHSVVAWMPLPKSYEGEQK